MSGSTLVNSLSHIKEVPALFTQAIESDIDSKTTMRAFEYTGPEDIHAVLRTITDYPMDPEGDWVHWRKEAVLSLVRRIHPCGHAHDCCGCVCGHWFDLTLHGEFIILTEHIQRNF